MATTTNEPESPACLRLGSLVFTPTAGMRVAPQVLMFELFRELGYGDSRDTERPGARDLNDVIGSPSLSDGERLLLAACRGRKRRDRRRKGDFYTPAYIGLTRDAWFRKQSDRALRDYFLGGPLAHVQGNGQFSDGDKNTIVGALIGKWTAHNEDDFEGKELLSLLGIATRKDPKFGTVKEHLEKALLGKRGLGGPGSAPLRGRPDTLASTITQDFVEVCLVEELLPRREWLFLLLAFIRVATSMWLLAHLRITVLVRDWVLAACSQQSWPREPEMLSALSLRHEGLLHPTSSPTREVFEMLDDYMRSRVELRMLVQRIGKECGGLLDEKLLTFDSPGSGQITLEELLIVARGIDWPRVTDGSSVRQWLTREAEAWASWRSPRNRGQGKQLREFIRVLYHFPDDDLGSSLLKPSRNAPTTKIIPGHRLLQLFAFLANRKKGREKSRGDQGNLVLRDIQEHMHNYGLDFRSSSFGRPLLVDTLSEAGLLIGSPDAGESAGVLDVIGAGRVRA